MKCNALFISDIHIGLADSKINEVLKFIKEIETPVIYLLGDIIDGWALKNRFNWPVAANTFFQKILKLARHGTKIYYCVGNHDAFLLPFVGHDFGNISIVEDIVHTTSRGEKILVLHGDKFDGLVSCAEWLQKLGAAGYDFLLRINTILNKIRNKLGMPYWSLSKYAKSKTKQALQYIDNFENIVCDYANKHDVNSILCGHIHEPVIKKINDIKYYNTGDAVENCTAIIETELGEIKLLEF